MTDHNPRLQKNIFLTVQRIAWKNDMGYCPREERKIGESVNFQGLPPPSSRLADLF